MEDENQTSEVAMKGKMRGPVAVESEGASSGTRPTPPTDAPEEFDGEMPEMCNPEDDDCEVPEMPEGFDGEGFMGGFGGRGDFNPMEMQETSSDAILHPVAYLALGGCSVILSIVIIYACFSKCFHKKPGETFDTLSKFIWFVAASIVLAAGLITLCYFIPVWVS